MAVCSSVLLFLFQFYKFNKIFSVFVQIKEEKRKFFDCFRYKIQCPFNVM